MKKIRAMGMSTVLIPLSLFLGMMALLAIMPLYPGHLPEGASPPMGEAEVRAAAEGLMAGARVLFLGGIIIEHVELTGRVIALFSFVAFSYVAFYASKVAGILIVWVGIVEGPMALFFRVAVGAPCVLLLLFAALHIVR